ncbi:MAG: S1C family serine protease [Gaiellaceae bacterium]|jgi:2-alkenal reductase|nr:trypsin-like peptidase domain-containing protein [Acidobacteriota bacterium]
MRRAPSTPVVLLALLTAAILGGAAALAIGAGAGWIGKDTKTVVVNAGAANTAAAALPAAVANKAAPIPGNGFDPARVYAERAAGVVTVYAFFGDPGDDATVGAQGSGFVISSKGYILTNAHVITNAGETNGKVKPASHVYVEFNDRDRVPAKVVGWDVYDDVGLIKVSPSDHPVHPVPLGESAAVAVGEPVAAIGSPLGNEDSLAVGVVSATRRAIPALTVRRYNVVDAIQTDAPITHGNSGGPLFDARGRVIGINAQIRSQSGTGNDSGVGFAIPIDAAKRSITQLLDDGRVQYAYVGITTQDLTPALARILGYAVKQGALVEDVRAGGPGAKAGLRGSSHPVNALGYRDLRSGGDVIVAINGKPVHGADDVVRIVSYSLKPDGVATFTIMRGREQRTVAVTLGDRAATPAAG